MTRRSFSLAPFLAALPLSAASPVDDAKEAAKAWVELVDQGKYPESWEQAAEIFRNKLTREQWVQAVEKVRGPMGGVQSRSLLAAEHTTSLPGVPDGEYVIVQYQTRFDKKESAVETLATALDADKVWRVAGYFIR